MAIETRHLRCFLAVAQTLHFGQAAERLHIAQPALPASIERLIQVPSLPQVAGVDLRPHQLRRIPPRQHR